MKWNVDWEKILRKMARDHSNSEESIIFEIKQCKIEKSNLLLRVKHIEQNIAKLEKKLNYIDKINT